MIDHRCTDDACTYCQNRAEDRQAERDEPISAAEESARADQYERWI